jgi:hypothetical protein
MNREQRACSFSTVYLKFSLSNVARYSYATYERLHKENGTLSISSFADYHLWLARSYQEDAISQCNFGFHSDIRDNALITCIYKSALAIRRSHLRGNERVPVCSIISTPK